MKSSLPVTLRDFIWHFLHPHLRPLSLFVLAAVVAGLWGPFNSFLLKYVIDQLSIAPHESIAPVIFWPAVLLILNYELNNLCWRTMAYLNYRFEPVIKNQIISETFDYIHRHTSQFFQDNLAGRIANQINTLADNIEAIVHDYSRNLIKGGVLVITALISMYWVHPKFLCVLLIWLLAFSAFSLWMSKRIISLSAAHAASESIVAGQLVDSITNASVVRTFARRIYEVSYLKKALLLTKQTFQIKEMFEVKLHLIQGTSISLMLGFMVYFLVQLWIKQKVSLGDFALVLGLASEVGFTTWEMLEEVSNVHKSVGKCKQSLARIVTPLDIKDSDHATSLLVSKGQITFSEVSFSYKGSRALLQRQSITIEPGQKVGLVGYSGSGKTTFVNLILRLYDVSEGQILIDGQDIRDVTQDSLRQSIAMIPQEPSLFHRSIMENIRYGAITATDEEVINAAKHAHAHEFISLLPQGYDSLVGDRGVKLSGGQRQRVAIARAILKNAPLLILDESTSQLDSLTESDIQESLRQLMQGKTTIMIAHRLSTLLYTDRILVFSGGGIVEDGSHRELLKKGGLYKSLWDAQVDDFLPAQRELGRRWGKLKQNGRVKRKIPGRFF